MYDALLDRTKESIGSLRRHLATSDRLRAAIHDGTMTCKAKAPCFEPISAEIAPDRVEWRIIDHCTAVTRLYAIYEHFSHQMVREHLTLLQSHYAFPDLSSSVTTAYRSGVSRILDKKDGPRYSHIDLSTLISQYNDALSGQAYKLEPEAMLIHEQNLRLPELSRLMTASGIEALEKWVEAHKSIKAFFGDEDRLASTAGGELLTLIDYRNDAAHGGIVIDDVLGNEVLEEFCDFVSALCEAIADKVTLSGLDSLSSKGALGGQGKIESCLHGKSVIVGMMTGSFSVGDTIYLCGDDYCYARNIVSIQVDDVDTSQVILDTETELGLGLDGPGRKSARLFKLAKATPVQATGEELKQEPA